MTTTNDAARPVAKIRVGGGPDPSTVMWITDSPPTTPILVYTAADFESLRQELDLQLLRDTQLCTAISLLTARAEAAEAGVRLAIRHAERWPDAWNEEDVVKLRAAINEDNSAGRGEG